MADFLTAIDIADILGIDDASEIPQQEVDWAAAEVKQLASQGVGHYTTLTDATYSFFFRDESSPTHVQLPYDGDITVSKLESWNPSEEDWIDFEGTSDLDWFVDDTGLVYLNYSLKMNVRYRITYSRVADVATDLMVKLQLLFVIQYLQNYNASMFTTASGTIKREKIGTYSIEYAVDSTSTSETLVDKDIARLSNLISKSGRWEML